MPLPDDFLELAREVNNWGRWGPGDEIGTLNLITDVVVRRAVACVKTGKRFSLALPLSEDGPMLGNIPGRPGNPERSMLSLHLAMTKNPDAILFSDDAVTMPLQCATHWDGLAHVCYSGRMYNGFPMDSVDERGASRLGIANVRTLVTRGVMLDVARAKSVDRLEGGYPITPEDLDAAESFAGVHVEPGDAILVRTGHMRWLKEGNKKAYSAGDSPGPGMAATRWLRARDIAAVATDSVTFEVWPCEQKGLLFPVHLLDLVEMGLTQGQNFDLESLAADCAADGVYEFLLSASPEPFERGLGSPVNPVAIK
ncbi:MAG: cyclase family protein [Actinomycetota bacterium]